MIKKLLLFICLLTGFFLYTQDIFALSSRPTRTITYPIRVAVITDASRISLKIKGHYNIYALPLLKVLKEGTGLSNVNIKPAHSGIVMGGEPFKIYGIKIKTDGDASIYINRRRFRGEIDIIRTEKLKLLVINHLDIEDYVSGVLYHEVSHRWPMEAIKAQAIASRTFAIYKSIESSERDYDLRSDIYSQVYGGRTSEKYRTNKAVDQTAGKMLIYKEEVLPAYFHATCGGHTENASVLWNTNLTPLKGQPCRYCEKSPHFNWITKISLVDIEKKLNKNGYRIRDIKAIKISSRNVSRRIKTVSIIDSLGVEKIPSNKFRLAIHPNIIRSANFKVKIKGNIAIFEGKGWGHGVGMCQWGAYFMAKRGLEAEDILRFYYPGAKIVGLREGRF